MRIQIICPAPAGSRSGNRITAERWVRLLRRLGHRARIAQSYNSERCDLLIALHARRSAGAVARFRAQNPVQPIVVALTGTDLYRDLPRSRKAQRSLRLADRLVVLQPLALRQIPRRWRSKGRVILQSATKTRGRLHPAKDHFDVAVIGHLRRVKDPFRTARAARLLPRPSRIRVLQAGATLERGMTGRARTEASRNARYRWLGELTPGAARRLLAQSRLLVVSSRLEGGANVISEAIIDGVPVLASRIQGNAGLLGARYTGYFPVSDTRGLSRLLRRAEIDARFYARLKKQCVRLARKFSPACEQTAWKKFLGELQRD